MLAVLAATPDRIADLADGVPAAALHAEPAAGEWSANGVLAHLRACADVWGGCIETILDGRTTTLRAVNPTTWIEQTSHRQQRFTPSLRAFTEQRATLLGRLVPLAPDGWDRHVTVTGAGRPLERTALDYADRMARHERAHLKQIQQAIAAVR